jgi:hypothetical protein
VSEEITVTRQQIKEALFSWEGDHRAGRTLTPTEARALPIEEYVERSTDLFWTILSDLTKP